MKISLGGLSCSRYAQANVARKWHLFPQSSLIKEYQPTKNLATAINCPLVANLLACTNQTQVCMHPVEKYLP